mmetsp:Transcript_28478/g.68495  ORF Transcript_28478/g.68495 Transcript_28478/m.68495 type:complete len:283 (+) Transcript_28478:354-1202(+)
MRRLADQHHVHRPRPEPQRLQGLRVPIAELQPRVAPGGQPVPRHRHEVRGEVHPHQAEAGEVLHGAVRGEGGGAAAGPQVQHRGAAGGGGGVGEEAPVHVRVDGVEAGLGAQGREVVAVHQEEGVVGVEGRLPVAVALGVGVQGALPRDLIVGRNHHPTLGGLLLDIIQLFLPHVHPPVSQSSGVGSPGDALLLCVVPIPIQDALPLLLLRIHVGVQLCPACLLHHLRGQQLLLRLGHGGKGLLRREHRPGGVEGTGEHILPGSEGCLDLPCGRHGDGDADR